MKPVIIFVTSLFPSRCLWEPMAVPQNALGYCFSKPSWWKIIVRYKALAQFHVASGLLERNFWMSTLISINTGWENEEVWKTQLVVLKMNIDGNTQLTYSALSLPTLGMGRRVPEQSRSHRSGPDLWGAQVERHRVPHVRAGDPLSHTHASAGKH